jgi:uncharacterized protein (TIGR00369 family)
MTPGENGFTELPHSKSCFVCGSRNVAGLNLRFWTDGRVVRARYLPRTEQNGFVNVVHGGILATVLDEVMVWSCAIHTKRFSYCAEMTVRYVAPAEVGQEIIATAELVENKRERLYLARGELKSAAGGRLIAVSTGKYMPIRDLDYADLLADFEGTEEQLREFLPRGGR